VPASFARSVHPVQRKCAGAAEGACGRMAADYVPPSASDSSALRIPALDFALLFLHLRRACLMGPSRMMPRGFALRTRG
jgi:hypothetical protein